MRNFEMSEFACHCCGKIVMDETFLEKLDRARELAGTPFKIVSGYRCQAHNIAVGSTSKNHVHGKAADIAATVGPQRGMILRGLVKAGFKRIGIDKQFIHVDDMTTEGSPESCWLY